MVHEEKEVLTDEFKVLVLKDGTFFLLLLDDGDIVSVDKVGHAEKFQILAGGSVLLTNRVLKHGWIKSADELSRVVNGTWATVKQTIEITYEMNGSSSVD